MLANSGDTTPPCGVPCEGNSGLMPDFRQRPKPFVMNSGAITRSKIALWLMRSKHFSMSSSKIRF